MLKTDEKTVCQPTPRPEHKRATPDEPFKQTGSNLLIADEEEEKTLDQRWQIMKKAWTEACKESSGRTPRQHK